jgi:hypothetical protein
MGHRSGLSSYFKRFAVPNRHCVEKSTALCSTRNLPLDRPNDRHERLRGGREGPAALGSSSFLWRIRLPTVFGLALGVVCMSQGQAQESRTSVIPATTGYGVDECLDGSGECGATVANAWCKAYGQGVALEFGRYGVDKSSASNESWPAPKQYYVDCSMTEPRWRRRRSPVSKGNTSSGGLQTPSTNSARVASGGWSCGSC